MRSDILVTGASGFVGRAVVQRLLVQGHAVRVLSRRAKLAYLSNFLPQLEIWQGDITVPDTLDGVTEGIREVYHLAGEIRNPQAYEQVNHLGTKYLVRTSSLAGVQRFLYLSSVGVIGAGTQAGHVDENTPVQPRNAYEVSKYKGEQAALAAHQQNGMHVVALRPSIVYGEERPPQTDALLTLIRWIQNGRFLQLGSQFVSSYIYVGDVVAACLTLMHSKTPGGHAFIINEPIPLSMLIAEIASSLGVSPPRTLPGPIGLGIETILRRTGRFASLYNRTTYSMDKLTKLGFTSPFGYREGLRRTLAWYQQEGYLT